MLSIAAKGSSTAESEVALGSAIKVSFFQNFAATSLAARPCALSELAMLIRTTSASHKYRLPWLKLARFGNSRTNKGSLRHDANILTITGVEADYDSESMPLDEALELLEKQGILSLIYTSPSHTDGAPRWRVLCPLSKELAPEDRNHHLGRLNGLFRGVFSGESWTLSQSYYFGSVNRNPSHRVEVIEGLPIDQHDDLDLIWLGKPCAASSAAHADEFAGKEAREDAELIRCAVTGQHLHVELCALAARYVGRNIPANTVEALLRGIMLSHPESTRDDRWQDRYNSIPELVSSAQQKYQRKSENECDQQRRAIAGAAFAMLRQRRPAQELVAELHRLNQQYSQPLPADVVNTTAIWCARQYAQQHDA